MWRAYSDFKAEDYGDYNDLAPGGAGANEEALSETNNTGACPVKNGHYVDCANVDGVAYLEDPGENIYGGHLQTVSANVLNGHGCTCWLFLDNTGAYTNFSQPIGFSGAGWANDINSQLSNVGYNLYYNIGNPLPNSAFQGWYINAAADPGYTPPQFVSMVNTTVNNSYADGIECEACYVTDINGNHAMTGSYWQNSENVEIALSAVNDGSPNQFGLTIGIQHALIRQRPKYCAYMDTHRICLDRQAPTRLDTSP